MIDFDQPSPDTNGGTRILDQFKLPDTMSGLLETALSDAHALDRYRYMPSWDQWHSSTVRSSCAICLAGSIIAGSFRMSPETEVHPCIFSDITFQKLEAVESMRSGDWWHAFVCIYDHAPNDQAEKLILALDNPLQSEFSCWDDFETHLESLQAFIPRLREIDEAETMPDHSPEPWTAQPAYDGPEWASNGEWFVHCGPWHIATIHAHRPGGFPSADAHLVRASPSLLRSCCLQHSLILTLLPYLDRLPLDDKELLTTAAQQGQLAIRMASEQQRQLNLQEISSNTPVIGAAPATSAAGNINATSRKLLDTLKILLGAAEGFERQASQGSGGRRGGELFQQVRKLIHEAEQVIP